MISLFGLLRSIGQLYLIEANPRFTLWNHLGAKCGVNLQLAAYQYLSGSDIVNQESYTTNLRWITFEDDYRALQTGDCWLR